MKKNIQVIAMCLVFLLALGLFAGCADKANVEGTSSETKGSTEGTTVAKPVEKVTIEFWSGLQDEQGPDQVVEAFNKIDPNIQVKHTRYVNDDAGNTKLDTALMAGEDVDVFISYGASRAAMRANNGSALELSDLFKTTGYDPVADVGGLLDEIVVDGKYYALPPSVQPRGYLVNMKMFEEAGIPLPGFWTIDEYKEIAKKLSSGEGTDRIFGAFIFDSDWDKWLRQAQTKLGGNVVYKDGSLESNFDNADIKRAMQLYYDMSMVDKSMPMIAETLTKKLHPRDMFLQGKAAVVDATWILRYIKDTETYPHDFKTAFAPYPQMDKDQADYFCPGGVGDRISIKANSTKIDAAWNFVEWYQTEGMIYVAPFGRIPASAKISKAEITKVMLEGVEDLFDAKSFEDYFLGGAYTKFASMTETIAAPEIAKIVKEEGDKAFTDAITVDEALANMKKLSDEAIKNAK